MQYNGGKSRLAKKFAPILQEALAECGGRFVEPFVGGFNLLPALGGAVSEAICSDVHPGLISLYWALQSGKFDPPESLSEEDYARIRAANDWDDPLAAFAAFGCSFGGKEWGGYARNSEGKNYALSACRSLLRKVAFMDLAKFVCMDYRDLTFDEKSVVYLDPPYLGTTGYKTGSFDYDVFYAWCEGAARRGARVFVSEFTIPDRPEWEIVWSTERHVMVDGKSQGRGRTRIDCLAEVKT